MVMQGGFFYWWRCIDDNNFAAKGGTHEKNGIYDGSRNVTQRNFMQSCFGATIGFW